MSLTFTTGTINQPDSGSVGQAMVEKIRDDVVAHVAWDLVEEFTAASGTVRWYVLKCLAAQSGLPSDYYVVMGRTLASGELRLFICETYSAASHIATNWAPGSYNSTFSYDASGRHTVDFTLGTTNTAGGSSNPDYKQWVPAGTSTKWWIIAAEDGFTVAMNGASNAFFHVGTYISLATMPITMPIQFTGAQGGTLTSAAVLTRNPAVANITCIAGCFQAYGLGSTSVAASYILGFSQADLRYNDKLQNGQRPIGEVLLQIMTNNAGDQAVMGAALGKHKRVRATGGNVPAGLAFGDAYVLQGRLWVPYNPADGRVWDTGVASS